MNRFVFFTSSLDSHDGWGRYSLGLLRDIAVTAGFPPSVIYCGNVSAPDAVSGMSVRQIPYTKGNSSLEKLADALRNYWALKSDLSDISHIHCLTEPLMPLTWLLARRKHFYITAHGTYAIAPLRRWSGRLLYGTIYRRADTIFCVSNYTAGQIKKFVPAARIKVIANGVDSALANLPVAPSEAGEYILGVGALKQRKGYEVALAAFAKIAPSYPKLKYVIAAGRRPEIYYEHLQALLAQLGIADRVEFRFGIGDGALAGLYRNAKFFVLTPVNHGGHFEGYGLVYLEAGLFGVPSVGTYANGAEDAIEDGKTGLLVKQSDVAGTAEAMTRLLEDAELRSRLGRAAQSKSRAQTWHSVARLYAESYA